MIDALIDKVGDPALRQALRGQVDSLLTKKPFGLVFQAHKPDTIELPSYKVKRRCKVRIRSEDNGELFRVVKVKGTIATLETLEDEPQQTTVEMSDLTVVREFGEPVYAGLKSVGRITRGGTKPFHLVINSENYHALETLLYTHEQKIDAIYIDQQNKCRWHSSDRR